MTNKDEFNNAAMTNKDELNNAAMTNKDELNNAANESSILESPEEKNTFENIKVKFMHINFIAYRSATLPLISLSWHIDLLKSHMAILPNTV